MLLRHGSFGILTFLILTIFAASVFCSGGKSFASDRFNGFRSRLGGQKASSTGTETPSRVTSADQENSSPAEPAKELGGTEESEEPASSASRADAADPASDGELKADHPQKGEQKDEASKEKAKGEVPPKAEKREVKGKAEGQVKAAFGEPLAAGMIKLLQDEIVNGFKRRGNSERFMRFQSYAIGKLNSSAGRYTGSELAGNCRLKWYDHLMRNVLAAPAEAEQFTRQLHAAARNPESGLGEVLGIAGEKMDVGQRPPCKAIRATTADQALDGIKQALTEAQVEYCNALAPLTKSEIRELQEYLVPVMCTQNQVGHTLNDRGTGRRLCDLMEKMDRAALHKSAEALAPIADVRVLDQLKSLSASGDVRVRGVQGRVLARIETPSGAIIIGGKESNTYQLDEMRDVAVVIDLGGGNTYLEGTVGLDRPVLVIINEEGKNVFRGSRAGIQGGAVLGVSMLLNRGGGNSYQAQDVAQGSALAGVGILIDFGANNRYAGVRRVQGQAIGGIGICIGRGGKNDYRAALWAQGFGGPLGFGMMDNVTGNNHYFCGGMWRDSYPETPGCEGWGQGVGAGIRQVANGGIGVILDNGGENTYEFDYLAHGGGYWCGLGFARDFGGNTKRIITRTAYNGGSRTEQDFQRFGCGWGCHYALGFCFDDSGDDVYEGTIMGTGMAWDCSFGTLCDFAGNDQYKATGGLTQGTGGQMGFGILFDYNGEDVYEGYGQGYASNGISYHTLPGCGGNFAFLVDYGGKDTYGCGAENNSYIQRGDSGGFVIDRPRREELEPTANTKSKTPQSSVGS